MITRVTLLCAALLVACVPSLPEGHYACEVAATDCPSGWSCVAGRCYSSIIAVGSDAGVLGADGSAPMPDAASTADAGVPGADGGADAAVLVPSDGGTIGTTHPIALAVGARHACAASPEGVVSCWGDDLTGALGATLANGSSPTPRIVPNVPSSRAVCAGAGYSCAVTTTGRVMCWGANDLWQLGRVATSPAPAAEVPGVPAATAVACGASHVCALTASGVWCWGANAHAQTGSAVSPRESPHFVSGVSAVALALGSSHSCALASNGSVACWGSSAMGQLGPSAPTTSASPVTIASMNASALAAGNDHTCAAMADGSVACWGCADSGRLGVVATGAHPSPVTVSGARSARLVASGAELSCAVSSDPTMMLGCWGSLAYGELGIGGSLRTGVQTSPSPVSLTSVTSVAAGSGFACAATETDVLCWGLNDRGQLGDGTNTTRTAPVHVGL